ncbi:MAG: hypothetical protein ACJA1L_003659, partial [Paracoccaceae bacterium]
AWACAAAVAARNDRMITADRAIEAKAVMEPLFSSAARSPI